MFNKIIKTIEKDNEANISPRLKLFEELKREMSSQYAFNPPDKKKRKKIDILRNQCNMERGGLEEEYIKNVEELNIKYMREEIKLLKETNIITK